MKIEIPPEALEAGARGLFLATFPNSADLWEAYGHDKKTYFYEKARAAFTAMVRAWPGGETVIGEAGIFAPCIYLPLQESSDDKG